MVGLQDTKTMPVNRAKSVSFGRATGSHVADAINAAAASNTTDFTQGEPAVAEDANGESSRRGSVASESAKTPIASPVPVPVAV